MFQSTCQTCRVRTQCMWSKPPRKKQAEMICPGCLLKAEKRDERIRGI